VQDRDEGGEGRETMTPTAYWMIGMDRYLDPPDEPTHWECDRCGHVFDGGDLNHNERGYEWICDDCLEEMGEEATDD
jgi:hypothetical protein